MNNGILTDTLNLKSELFVNAFSSVFIDETPSNIYSHQVYRGTLSSVLFSPRDVELQLRGPKSR